MGFLVPRYHKQWCSNESEYQTLGGDTLGRRMVKGNNRYLEKWSSNCKSKHSWSGRKIQIVYSPICSYMYLTFFLYCRMISYRFVYSPIFPYFCLRCFLYVPTFFGCKIEVSVPKSTDYQLDWISRGGTDMVNAWRGSVSICSRK